MSSVPVAIDRVRSRGERIDALGYDYASQAKSPMMACNLCGSDQWIVLTHRDRYGFHAQTTGCSVCGLVMLNPRMTAAAYSRFYDGIYRPLVSAYHGRRIDALSIQEDQRTYAGEMEQILAPFLEGSSLATLLDVGGSTGVVAAHLAHRFGLRATVLDPAPAETSEAMALGIETITALVEEWQPGSKRYDVIGMFETIDHLLDIDLTLRKLRAVIHPDGLFVVDIVDFRAAYLKNWSVEAALKIDHPFSLTEDTAESFLARAGFKPIRKAYSADHLLVSYICRPCQANPDALPGQASAERFFREIRFVRSAPCPTRYPE
jgi:hypothetical protein